MIYIRVNGIQLLGMIKNGLAYGFICIFEGMLKFLFGEIVSFSPNTDVKNEKILNTSLYFNENSIFTEGYCLEFVLQLMKDGKYNQHFEVNKFINDLLLYGNSVVVVKNDSLIKVHIHTKHLSRTISLCEEFGVFVDFKIDNMRLQKNARLHEKTNSSSDKKALAKIAVSNGDGITKIFEDLGCDIVINERFDDTVSTRDFYESILSLNAERVVIFPNNKNSVMSAEQAVKMFNSNDISIDIIPTENVVDGYFSLALDIPDLSAVGERIKKMRMYKEGLSVIGITVSQKDGIFDGVECARGDYLSLIDGKIVSSQKDIIGSIVASFNMCNGIEKKDSGVAFYGKDISDDVLREIESKLEALFPDIEIEYIEGGQEVYSLLFGLV